MSPDTAASQDVLFKGTNSREVTAAVKQAALPHRNWRLDSFFMAGSYQHQADQFEADQSDRGPEKAGIRN